MPDLPTIAPSPLLRDVVDLMIQGNSLPSIHDWVTNHGGDPADTIANAHEYFAAVAVRNKPQAIIGWVMESYRDIYRQALMAGDLPTARGCLKDMQSLAMKVAEYEMEDPSDAEKQAKERKRHGKVGAVPSSGVTGRKQGKRQGDA